MILLIVCLVLKELRDMIIIFIFTELLLCAKFWQPLLNYLSLNTPYVAFQRWLQSRGLSQELGTRQRGSVELTGGGQLNDVQKYQNPSLL